MSKIPESLKQLSAMGTLTWKDILEFYGEDKAISIFQKWASKPLIEITVNPYKRIRKDTKIYIFTEEELKIIGYIQKKKRVKTEELQTFADKNNISINAVNNFINKKVVKAE